MSHANLSFKKIGEFPLIEGSFKHLTFVYCPVSMNYAVPILSSYFCKQILNGIIISCWKHLDDDEVKEFTKKNQEESKHSNNYGFLNKFT